MSEVRLATRRVADSWRALRPVRLVIKVTGLLAFGPLCALLVPNAHTVRFAALCDLAASLVVASGALFVLLRPLLGFFSSFAALSALWGLLGLISAASASTCPGFNSHAACTTPQLAANTLLGALLPLVALLFVLPFSAQSTLRRSLRFRTTATGRLHAKPRR